MMTAADLVHNRGAGTEPRASGPGDLERFQPGTTVMHPDYGIGRIVSIEGAGAERKGRVAFAVGPPRTFVLSKSPLRPLPKPAPNGPRAVGTRGGGPVDPA